MSDWNKIAIEFIVDDMLSEHGERWSKDRARETGRALLLNFSLGPSFSNFVRCGLDVLRTEVTEKEFYEYILENNDDYREWIQSKERLELVSKTETVDDWRHRLIYWDSLFRPSFLKWQNQENMPYRDQFIIFANTKQPTDVIFPSTGIYIYFHPYEGYKIGQAENVPRRMDKHHTSAPAAQLLHVIETNDLDWCEGFIHGRFARWRRRKNHEYFDLERYHLMWLFSIDVLNRPKPIGDQLSLLDLL